MTYTFKVGDRVRRTEDHPANVNKRRGYEFTISEVFSKTVVEGDYVIHNKDRIELVETKEEKVTFKAGDTVRGIERGSGVVKGEIYRVEKAYQISDEDFLLVRPATGGDTVDAFAYRFELVTPEAPETYDTYDPRMLPLFAKAAEAADKAGYCNEYDTIAAVVGAPSRAEIKKLLAPVDPLQAARDAFAAIPLGHTFHFTSPGEDKTRKHIKVSDTEYMHNWANDYGYNGVREIEDLLSYGIEAN